MSRLQLAFPTPPEGKILVIGADARSDLSALPRENTTVIQGFEPDYKTLEMAGWQVRTGLEGDESFDKAIVFLPRARAEARLRIHDAARHLAAKGQLWIDGQKTDGVDSMLKEIRNLTAVEQVTSKAHGKIFHVPETGWVPADWSDTPRIIDGHFKTRAGVFSADGVDEGSHMLASLLPERLPTRIVDLGAGWGWLSAQILTRQGVQALHLVEANATALDCARENISDNRVQFHWADAASFTLPDPVNGVIMNPPFHAGTRSGDPQIGAVFIAAAARLMTGAGRLWMVANRHLPYERVLESHFAHFEEIGGDNRFKILTATGAQRGKKKARTAR